MYTWTITLSWKTKKATVRLTVTLFVSL